MSYFPLFFPLISPLISPLIFPLIFPFNLPHCFIKTQYFHSEAIVPISALFLYCFAFLAQIGCKWSKQHVCLISEGPERQTSTSSHFVPKTKIKENQRWVHQRQDSPLLNPGQAENPNRFKPGILWLFPIFNHKFNSCFWAQLLAAQNHDLFSLKHLYL